MAYDINLYTLACFFCFPKPLQHLLWIWILRCVYLLSFLTITRRRRRRPKLPAFPRLKPSNHPTQTHSKSPSPIIRQPPVPSPNPSYSPLPPPHLPILALFYSFFQMQLAGWLHVLSQTAGFDAFVVGVCVCCGCFRLLGYWTALSGALPLPIPPLPSPPHYPHLSLALLYHLLRRVEALKGEKSGEGGGFTEGSDELGEGVCGGGGRLDG